MSHRRAQEDKQRLKHLYEETRHWIGGGAYFDSRKDRYIRYTWNKNGQPRYLRRCGHRKVRRMRDVPDRGGYRRVYDYWWNLY